MNALIWKMQRKKTRKCSKVSVKKYQNRPRLGDWSGTERLQRRGTDREKERKREREECTISMLNGTIIAQSHSHDTINSF